MNTEHLTVTIDKDAIERAAEQVYADMGAKLAAERQPLDQVFSDFDAKLAEAQQRADAKLRADIVALLKRLKG